MTECRPSERDPPRHTCFTTTPGNVAAASSASIGRPCWLNTLASPAWHTPRSICFGML